MSHTYIYTYIITRIHTYIYIYMRKSSTNPEADSLDCEIFSVTLGSRLVLRKSLLTTLFPLKLGCIGSCTSLQNDYPNLCRILL